MNYDFNLKSSKNLYLSPASIFNNLMCSLIVKYESSSEVRICGQRQRLMKAFKNPASMASTIMSRMRIGATKLHCQSKKEA